MTAMTEHTVPTHSRSLPAMVALLAALLCGAPTARAVEPDADPDRVEVWASAMAELDLKKKFEVDLTQHLRITPDPLRVWELLLDVEGSKDFGEALRLGLGLRGGGRDFVPGRLEPRFRAHADLRLKGSFGIVSLSLRERYQYRIPTWVRDGAHTIRSKGQVKVQTGPRVDVFAAVEPFLRPGPDLLHRVRVEGGLQFDLPEKMDLEVFYRLEEPIADRSDPRTHIAGIGFSRRVKVRGGKKR